MREREREKESVCDRVRVRVRERGRERERERGGIQYFMHGEVREEDGQVVLYPDDQPRLSLVATGHHLHVVAVLERLLQLPSLKC